MCGTFWETGDPAGRGQWVCLGGRLHGPRAYSGRVLQHVYCAWDLTLSSAVLGFHRDWQVLTQDFITAHLTALHASQDEACSRLEASWASLAGSSLFWTQR